MCSEGQTNLHVAVSSLTCGQSLDSPMEVSSDLTVDNHQTDLWKSDWPVDNHQTDLWTIIRLTCGQSSDLPVDVSSGPRDRAVPVSSVTVQE